MHTPRPPAPRRRYLLAMAGYALAALLVMAPALPRFATAIPGGLVAAVDGWQNVWNLWWARVALAGGRNPFFSDLIFYPQGAPLSLQTLGISNGLLALPVTAIWGPTAGYNAALLLSLALSGLAGYALALDVCGDRRAAFLAGLIFTCSPYHLSRVYDGQLELISLQWPTFYVLFLLRAMRRPSLRDGLLAGVFLAVTGYTSLYYLIFMGLFSAAFLFFALVDDRPSTTDHQMQDALRHGRWSVVGRHRHTVALVSLPVIVGMLLLLPLIVPALATAVGRNGAVLSAGEEEILGRSANLLDFLLPSYLHPLWGQAVFDAAGRAWHVYSGDWNAAFGYSVLALAALGARSSWRATWRWLAVFGLALLFALGPQLQIGPWRSGLPMPYALLDLLPGLSLGRRPVLFVALATIALIPPTALGLRALFQLGEVSSAFVTNDERRTTNGSGLQPLVGTGRRSPVAGRWSLVITLALLAFELAPRPWPSLPANIPPYYAELAGRPGALLEVPPAHYKYSLPQLAQTVHGRPIFGGYLARPPVYDLPNEAPALRALWQMRLPDGPPLIDGMTDPLVPLNYYGVGDVVVRWDQIAPDRRPEVAAILEQSLPGVAPEYADGAISVYHVPPAAPRPFAGLIGPGWHPAESDGARSWRWMRDTGTILLVNPTAAPLPLTLRLRAQGYRGPRDVGMSFDGADAGVWSVGAGETDIALRLWLAPGAHRLALRARADPEAVADSGRVLSIALLDARISTP